MSLSSFESVADGHEAAYRRLTEIAASIAPRLQNPRGIKVRAASAAHEFFLENVVMPQKPRAYTWDQYKEDFTDSMTEATRHEFEDCEFDPRPAYRRFKARQRQNSVASRETRA